MNTQPTARSQQQFSVSHFQRLGQRYGINYCFPEMSELRGQATVVQGHVDEILLPSGINVTCSDLQVVETYESTSSGSSPLYILVVLEGCVRLRLNGAPYCVRAGMSLATLLEEQQVMNARHQSAERLVTMSLVIHPAHFNRHSAVASLLHEWQQRERPAGLWHIPDHLLSGFRRALYPGDNPLARQLMLEGLLLQLLAHQLIDAPLPECQSMGELPMVLSPGERQRLEQVRQLLQAAPEKGHTLDELARLAAMSPSSLRSKFRQTYGDSVFNYLRDCRLELARRYLREGYSVQQAAWMSGYQHATNFATAFRRRYGIAPSALPMK